VARPTKQGIDYFPLDCRFDDKTEMYLIEKGAVGLGVLVTIWQMIYSGEGYYVDNNKDLQLLIKRKIDSDINEVIDCINICLSRNIFCSGMHKKHNILTSKAIQSRYFEAAKKKKSVQININYIINGIDSYDNWINVGGNATNIKEKVKVKEKVNKGGNKINFESWPSVPDEQLLNDWMAMRKRVKASCSQSAINTIGKQLHLAVSAGYTVDQCIAEAESRSWKGFKLEWMKNNETSTGNNQRSSAQRVSEKLDEIAAADIAENGFTHTLDN